MSTEILVSEIKNQRLQSFEELLHEIGELLKLAEIEMQLGYFCPSRQKCKIGIRFRSIMLVII